MPWHYIVPLLIAAVISGTLAISAWRHRPGSGTMALALLMLAVAEWAIASALAHLSLTLRAKLFWTNIQYIGVVIVPAAWLAFVLEYTNNDQYLRGYNKVWLTIEPVLVHIVMWTNAYHQLFRSDIWLDTRNGFLVLATTLGPAFWVHAAYSYVLLVLSTILLIRAHVRSPKLYRRQTIAMIGAIAMPWLSNGLFLTGLSPFPHLDLTPFAFTITGILMIWGVLRFGILDIIPVARDIMIENMKDGVIVLDPKGRIIDFNPVARQIIHPSQTELVGHALREVAPTLANTISARRPHTDVILNSADTPHIYDLNVVPLYDRRHTHKGQLIVLHDVTERKQAEENLSRSSERLQILHEIDQAILAAESPENIAQAALARLQRLMPCHRASIAQVDHNKQVRLFAVKSYSDLDEDAIIWKGLLQTAIFRDHYARQTMGTSANQVYAFFQEKLETIGVQDHLIAPLRIQGEIIGSLNLESQTPAVFSDDHRSIATKIAASLAIAIQQARLKTTLQERAQRLNLLHEVSLAVNASLNLTEIMVATGQGLVANFSSCDHSGIVLFDESLSHGEVVAEYPDFNAVGTHIPIQGNVATEHVINTAQPLAIDDAQHDPMMMPLWETMRSIGVQSILLVPIMTSDRIIGTLGLDAIATRHHFKQAEIELVQTVTAQLAIAIEHSQLYASAQQEIAERQLAEAALHISEAALRHYTAELETQIAELDAFAHTVAHDLKNPLTSLIGYSNLLGRHRHKIDEEATERYTQAIAQNARKMSNIIDEILLLSSVRKVEEVTLAPIDMANVIQEAQKRLKDLILKHEATLILPESWLSATGYTPWIEEVWVNYISNAIKYGGRPPRVELGATVESGHPTQIQFWVRDNGDGLSAEQQSQLFVPFERLEQVRAEGHGLGLSIVRRIIEKLGGQVGVESAGIPGEGCTFYFILPKAETSS